MNGNDSAYPVSHTYMGGEKALFFGMTIRQRYAMAAMQGMLSDDKTSSAFVDSCGRDWDKAREKVAWTAFSIADAMIEFEEQEYAEKQKELGDKKTQDSD